MTGSWDYLKPSDVTAPSAGQATHANKGPSQILISKTDELGADRSADLATVSPGDVLVLQGIRYSITATIDDVSHVSFAVAPAVQAPAEGVFEFTFEEVVASSSLIVDDVDWWVANGTGEEQGIFALDDAPEHDQRQRLWPEFPHPRADHQPGLGDRGIFRRGGRRGTESHMN